MGIIKKENNGMKTKELSASAMLRNINGLSKGDVAYCGPYGTVTCTESAKESKSGVRKFKVSGSSRLRNGGNWTMNAIRRAFAAAG